MCHCLYQVVTQRFQQSTMDSVWTVIGTVIFLRFINPAIGEHDSSLGVFCGRVDVAFAGDGSQRKHIPCETGHTPTLLYQVVKLVLATKNYFALLQSRRASLG